MEKEPMINVRYPKEVVDFLKTNCSMVEIDGIQFYRPAPFWYTQKYLGDENLLSVYNELPKQED